MPADAIGEAGFYLLKFAARCVLEIVGSAVFEFLWDRGCYWTGRIVWWTSSPVRSCFTPVKSPPPLTEVGYKVVGFATWAVAGGIALIIWL